MIEEVHGPTARKAMDEVVLASRWRALRVSLRASEILGPVGLLGGKRRGSVRWNCLPESASATWAVLGGAPLEVRILAAAGFLSRRRSVAAVLASDLPMPTAV